MKEKIKIKKHLSPFQVIIFGFLLVILIGALLLTLPFASNGGGFTSFSDALFTAVSAVCVTGLVVVDTATHWSFFGQLIIITLIQIGGLGVVTVAASVTMFAGKKIGLMQRNTMSEAMAAGKIGGVVKLLRFILLVTFIFEVSGALLLMPVFCKDFGILKGIWYSFFHSISAFCNAGFDLMGKDIPFYSITAYGENTYFVCVIILLILFGGLGFLTWGDIKTHRFKLKKYTLQSKVILSMSAILILLPTLFFFFFEFKEGGLKNRILYSLFQSVTPRTAGFNTVDLTSMSQVSQFVMIILMLIGGSPGSTAGGMKTTTIAVVFISAFSIFSRKPSPEVFGRRLNEDTVRHAGAILIMYITLFLGGSIAISVIDSLPLIPCMFEAGSAVATVGCTLSLTSTLSLPSQIIIMILMFLGRVGGLTLIYAVTSGAKNTLSKLPQEKITVG